MFPHVSTKNAQKSWACGGDECHRCSWHSQRTNLFCLGKAKYLCFGFRLFWCTCGWRDWFIQLIFVLITTGNFIDVDQKHIPPVHRDAKQTLHAQLQLKIHRAVTQGQNGFPQCTANLRPGRFIHLSSSAPFRLHGHLKDKQISTEKDLWKSLNRAWNQIESIAPKAKSWEGEHVSEGGGASIGGVGVSGIEGVTGLLSAHPKALVRPEPAWTANTLRLCQQRNTKLSAPDSMTLKQDPVWHRYLQFRNSCSDQDQKTQYEPDLNLHLCRGGNVCLCVKKRRILRFYRCKHFNKAEAGCNFN